MKDKDNNSELDALIGDCLDGRLSEAEANRLSQWIEESSEARQRYWELASVHGMIEQSMQSASLKAATGEVSVTPVNTERPFRCSRITSAAAGMLIGIFGASVAWAYMGPKTPEVSRINVPLVDPGFEEVITPVPSVIPRALNRWNGDASHTVSSGDSGVKPKQGRFMMKMQPVEDRPYSRIEQIVDVSHLVPAEGGAVTFSASTFSDGAPTQSKMLLVLRAFTMDSEAIAGSTEKLDDQVTSEARKRVLIPAGSTDWHAGSLRMDLPANTKTIVFSIAAVDLPKASAGSSRYIDDLKATIVTTHPAEIQP